MPDKFAALLRELKRRGIDPIVVGGHALALNGCPHLTHDLDVLVKHDEGQKDSVEQILYAFPHDEPEEDFYFLEIRSGVEFIESTMSTPAGKLGLDVISGEKIGVDFYRHIKDHAEPKFDNVLVAKTEDVILMKAEVKRAKDLEGIRNALRGPEPDAGYLKEYGEKYGKLEPLLDALERVADIYDEGSKILRELSGKEG